MKKIAIIASVILASTLASVPASAGDTEKGILIGVLGTLVGQEIVANRRHRNAHVHTVHCGHVRHPVSVPSPSHGHGHSHGHGIAGEVIDQAYRDARIRRTARRFEMSNRYRLERDLLKYRILGYDVD